MATSSEKQTTEKEEFYDDIKLPVTLRMVPRKGVIKSGQKINNRDDGHFGIWYHPSPTSKPGCCDSCQFRGGDESEEEASSRKLYECPHCGLRFLLSIALKFHIKGSHGPDQFYHCSYCQFSSHILSQVRRHVRESHTMEKRHCCPHCKYKAKRSTHLRRHIEARHDAARPPKRHYIKHETDYLGEDDEEEKPLLCSECNYSTLIPRSLKRHIKLAHEGNCAIHKCPQCDSAHSTLRELRHHIKVDHEHAKCFDCPLCPYRTVHLGSLKNHIMAKHTDEKGHKCPHCSYRAVQSGNLKRHISAKHPNKLKAKGRQKAKN